MLNFNPAVRASEDGWGRGAVWWPRLHLHCSAAPPSPAGLEMTIARPCICPMVVARGGDQTQLSTRFETRDDPAVLRNYGALLVQVRGGRRCGCCCQCPPRL